MVPFRKRRRTYQREWRFLRSLCKIRDAIAPAILDIDGPLSRLTRRGELILAVRAIEDHGAKDLGEQDQFVDAVKIARRISMGVEELASLIRQLERMDKR